MTTPSSSSSPTTNINISESLFLSAWNNTWLPHPTRDVTTSLYPWTEDAGRDFLLQTALSMCCGVRPSPDAKQFNLSQLTPAHGQPAPLAPGQSPLASTSLFASESPSLRQKKQEEALLKVFFRDLIEIKNDQFQKKQKEEKEAEQDEEIEDVNNNKDDNDDGDQNRTNNNNHKKRQRPPKLTAKELSQAMLPSAFWMQSSALHPIAISNAWRSAFNVQPLEEELLLAQDEIRKELFDYNNSDEYEYEPEEEQQGETNNNNDDEKTLQEQQNNSSEDSPPHVDNSNSQQQKESVWKLLYEAAIEDRSLAATHVRGIISRKLTLDRFSVRELAFIWHLVCGPRTSAMKWFRKFQKNLTSDNNHHQSPSSLNNNNHNRNSALFASPTTTTNSDSSAASPVSSNNASSLKTPLNSNSNNNSLLLQTTMTLQQTGLYPSEINMLFAPLTLSYINKKDSLMFDMRALYFGVLEQHNIGKERRVIGGNKDKEVEEDEDEDERKVEKDDKAVVAPEESSSRAGRKKKQQQELEEKNNNKKKAAAAAAAVATVKKQVTIIDDPKAAAKNKQKQAPARRQREGKEDAIEIADDDDDDEAAETNKTKEQQEATMKKKKPAQQDKSSTSSVVNFGFLFGDKNAPARPYFDRNEDLMLQQQKALQQRRYSLLVFNNNDEHSSSLAKPLQLGSGGNGSSELFNAKNQPEDARALMRGSKPEIELSSAADLDENDNQTAVDIPITQLSIPSNNKNNNNTNMGAFLPRHSAPAWQLVETAKGGGKKTTPTQNKTPAIWQEYYRRCAKVIKGEGIQNTDEGGYLEGKS